MATRLRIATFNLENLDETTAPPTLADRLPLLQPALRRIDADILCLQEVHSQAVGNTRRLRALDTLLAGTPYETFSRAFTTTTATGSVPLTQRNIVILSRFPVVQRQQYKNDLVPAPRYKMVTAIPPATGAEAITFERPVLRARLQLNPTQTIDVLGLHLKSKLPTDIPGQKTSTDRFAPWRQADAYAEGSFISTMKRVGQALEVRRIVDSLFDADANAWVAVCGDFNADYDEVSIEAIRGDVENTENPAHATRVLVPCERSVPEPARYSLFHHGRGTMLDHILVSRPLLASYRHTEVHNEILHDESIAFATDVKYPESDHAPVVAEFLLPD